MSPQLEKWKSEAAVLRALRPRHILFLCVANSARRRFGSSRKSTSTYPPTAPRGWERSIPSPSTRSSPSAPRRCARCFSGRPCAITGDCRTLPWKPETRTGNWRHSAASGTNFGGGWNFCSKIGANRERRTAMGKKGTQRQTGFPLVIAMMPKGGLQSPRVSPQPPPPK